MATCNPTIDSFAAEAATLAVSEKYKQLMQDTLSDESIYTRAKDTFAELYRDLDVSENEKIQIITNNIIQLTTSLSAQAMTSALAWAKEERDGAYTLAQTKAQTELVHAQKELTAQEICKAEKETALACANIEAIKAGTIRENGRVATYDADGCTPLTLHDEGLRYAQEKQLDAQKYQILADAFRKSGVVTVGTDADGVEKGTAGDTDGYTIAQELFVERQIKSFEDSKRNHAANASSQMLGQLLSAEVPITETDTAFVVWKTAMDYLNTNTP